MNIYYWSPFLSPVATVKAVINSAKSMKRYSNGKINPCIINAVGEWNAYHTEIRNNHINIFNFSFFEVFYSKLPRFGFIKSRLSYLLIICFSIFQLHKFLRKTKKNDIFVMHLLVSAPLILLLFFSYNCKFVLRVSGLPKLNLFRKNFWKLSGRNLSFITCPTEYTKNDLIKQNVFDRHKVKILKDPIIEISIVKKKLKSKESLNINSKYCLCIGRLTKQKNFQFVIKNFRKIIQVDKDVKLLILGDGEDKKKLTDLVLKEKLQESIYFYGYQNNVYYFLKNAHCFILCSNWEDPGWVLLEAAVSRSPIISSDCHHGPKEIIEINNAGYIFKKNNPNSFVNIYKSFLNEKVNQPNEFRRKIFNALKVSKNYTTFYHYKHFYNILFN
jgi:glycosyltransferase involved in cell wall biosynthesis